MRRWFLMGGLLLAFLSGPSVAAPSKKKTIKRVRPTLEQKVTNPLAASIEKENPRGAWLLRPSLGFSRWQGTGFWSGLGVGYLPAGNPNWVWGLDTSLLLVSQGSLFSSLLGGWYTWESQTSSPHSYSLGLMGGPGFPSGGLPGGSAVTWIVQTELAWNQRLNDFVSLRVLLKSGLINQGLFFQPAIGFLFQIR